VIVFLIKGIEVVTGIEMPTTLALLLAAANAKDRS
jgi:hypothetical protein